MLGCSWTTSTSRLDVERPLIGALDVEMRRLAFPRQIVDELNELIGQDSETLSAVIHPVPAVDECLVIHFNLLVVYRNVLG